MKHLLSRIAYLLLGAVVTLGLLEIVMRILPVVSALPLWDVSATNPIRRLLPYSTQTYSRNWDLRAVMRRTANNEGFINSQTYLLPSARHKPLVGVVGDSFVAALMVPYEETFFGLTQAHLQSRADVYSFGMPGSNASEYLALTKFAHDRFAPSTLVVLITATNLQWSIIGNARPIPDMHFFQFDGDHINLVRIQRGGEELRTLFSDSALARYAYFHLKSHFELPNSAVLTKLLGVQSGSNPNAAISLTRQYQAARYFLDQLPRESHLPKSRIIIVFDADRLKLYTGQKSTNAVYDWMPQEAMRDGYRVIDLNPVFTADWRIHHRYFDWYPEELHWNGYAHSIVARELENVLDSGPL